MTETAASPVKGDNASWNGAHSLGQAFGRGWLAPFPDWRVALLVWIAVVAELVLLGWPTARRFSEDHLLAGVVPLYLAWFWFTLGWIGWRVLRSGYTVTQPWSPLARIISRGLLSLVVGAAAFGYIASWWLLLNWGQFLNWDAVRFLWYQPFFQDERQVRAAAWHYTMLLVGLLGLSLMVASLGLRWLGRAADRRERFSAARWAPRVVWYALTCAILSWDLLFLLCPDLSRSVSQAEFLRRHLNPVVSLFDSLVAVLFEEAVEPCLDLSDLAPMHERNWQAPPATDRNRPNIILIAIDSLRQDIIYLRHQGHEVTPHLNFLARQGLQWTRAYAPSTHTDYSTVAVIASLYPLRKRHHHFYQTIDPWPRTLLYDLLQPAGYHTALFSSQNESWGNMERFYRTPHLDVLNDFRTWRQDVASLATAGTHEARHVAFQSLDDAWTTDQAIAWLTPFARRGEPFMLLLNYANPHFPYQLSAGKPAPFQPSQFTWSLGLSPAGPQLQNMRHAYYNCLHDSDAQLGRLLAALAELQLLQRTILVVYGDHGESWGEHDQYFHGNLPYEAESHVGCIMYAPTYLAPRQDPYPLELIDVVPTILGLMGWPVHPNFQGIDALAPTRPSVAQRLVWCHTDCLERGEAVLLAGKWKWLVDRNRHVVALYDLEADPFEQTNLASKHPGLANELANVLALWRKRQLAYYHFPLYSASYYPPQAPFWTSGQSE